MSLSLGCSHVSGEEGVSDAEEPAVDPEEGVVSCPPECEHPKWSEFMVRPVLCIS